MSEEAGEWGRWWPFPGAADEQKLADHARAIFDDGGVDGLQIHTVGGWLLEIRKVDGTETRSGSQEAEAERSAQSRTSKSGGTHAETEVTEDSRGLGLILLDSEADQPGNSPNSEA